MVGILQGEVISLFSPDDALGGSSEVFGHTAPSSGRCAVRHEGILLLVQIATEKTLLISPC